MRSKDLEEVVLNVGSGITRGLYVAGRRSSEIMRNTDQDPVHAL